MIPLTREQQQELERAEEALGNLQQLDREAEAQKQLDSMTDEPEKKQLSLKDIGIHNRADARAAGLRIAPRQRAMKVPKNRAKFRSRNSR